jgi:hypothetical protein
MAEKFNKGVRSAVEHAGGELVASNGAGLKLIPASRYHISPKPAWPIISPPFTVEQLNGCTEVQKGKLLDAIAANTARGQKTAEKERVMQELREAGAVKTTEYTILRAFQAKSEVKEIEIG